MCERDMLGSTAARRERSRKAIVANRAGIITTALSVP
jgi:hypothetical protein